MDSANYIENVVHIPNWTMEMDVQISDDMTGQWK